MLLVELVLDKLF